MSLPCARGPRCVDTELDAQNQRVPRFTEDIFCIKDTLQIKQVLIEAPDLYLKLDAELPKTISHHGEQVSGSKNPPCPIRLEIMTLIEELVTLLETHAAILRGYSSIRRFETVVRQDSEYLKMRLADVLSSNGGDIGLHLLDWKERTRRALGMNRYIEKRKAPCPQCDTFTLMRRDGEDTSQCKMCHLTLTQEEYMRWVHWLATSR